MKVKEFIEELVNGEFESAYGSILSICLQTKIDDLLIFFIEWVIVNRKFHHFLQMKILEHHMSKVFVYSCLFIIFFLDQKVLEGQSEKTMLVCEGFALFYI